MVETIYYLFRLILGFVLAIPTFILIGVFDGLNTKGKYTQIVEDLKSFFNWFWPGIF